jgi:GPH family glycoside/pentoside/hexuronide:cation symporter
MLLIGAKMFQFLAFASTGTTSLLFMLNVLHVGYAGQMKLALIQNAASALSMPGWLWLERRTGKRNAYLVGILIMCCSSSSWLLASDGIGFLGLALRGLASGIGSGGMILLSISMLSDALAYDRETMGVQREGLLSSFTAVVEKASFALGVAIIGAFLNFAHYVPTKNGAIIQQPDSAVSALYACFAVIPVALFALNALCILFYPLGGKSLPVKITTIDPEPAAL